MQNGCADATVLVAQGLGQRCVRDGIPGSDHAVHVVRAGLPHPGAPMLQAANDGWGCVIACLLQEALGPLGGRPWRAQQEDQPVQVLVRQLALLSGADLGQQLEASLQPAPITAPEGGCEQAVAVPEGNSRSGRWQRAEPVLPELPYCPGVIDRLTLLQLLGFELQEADRREGDLLGHDALLSLTASRPLLA